MTKDKHQIKVDKRTILGRKVKHLRKDGSTPSTIYGHKFESISIQFKTTELEKVFKEAGESGLIELLIGEEKLPVLLRNPQYDPITSNLLHVDCYKVNLKEKITALVPIEFIGESQAVKDGNVLVEVTDEIEIEALPTDLPKNIEVDLSILKAVDDMINVADLKIDNEKLTVMTHLEQVIIKIEEPRVEEEILPTPEEVEEGEEGGEVAPGDVPATEQKTEEEKEADDAKKAEEKKEEGKKEK
jgi:large subunit ribosomal protein L25